MIRNAELIQKWKFIVLMLFQTCLNKDILKNAGNQTVWALTEFHRMRMDKKKKKNTMEVKREPKHSSKYLLLSSAEKKKVKQAWKGMRVGEKKTKNKKTTFSFLDYPFNICN